VRVSGRVNASSASAHSLRTIGKGIAHSERTQQVRHLIKDGKMIGIQSWVALPKHLEDCEPSFHNLGVDQVPVIPPSDECKGAQLRLIAGDALGCSSPLPVDSPLFYMHGSFAAGSSFSMQLQPTHEGAVYPVSGSVRIRDTVLNPGDMGVCGIGERISFQTTEPSEVMVFGGASAHPDVCSLLAE
jgi:redox-sensitive bicupin YhaK (pirin superfamily)